MKKKTKKHHRQHRKPRKPITAIVPATPTQTIVRRRELHFSREQIDLIKENVAKGTTDEQLQLFLYVCKKHRLDPLAKQIYCVLWPRQGGKFHDMVIITGINGFRTTAARDHKDFAGTSKPIFTYQDTVLNTPAGRRIPESCTMKAFRKGFPEAAAEVEVYWSEFAPTDLKVTRSDFWNRMPRHMLAKCAEAQVLRKAYPDLSDVYIEEEVAQRMADFTPGGREIVLANGENPSGRVADGQRSDPIRDKAIAEARAKGLWCDKHNCPARLCPSDEHSAGELEAFDVAEQAAKGQPTEKPNGASSASQNSGNQPQERFVGTIEVDWTADPKSPRLMGALSNLLPVIQEHCKSAEWGKDQFWHLAPKDVPTIAAICKKLHYEFVETLPAKSSGSRKATPETKPKSGGADAGAKQSPAAPTLVNGTIHRTIMGSTSRNQPCLSVKVGNEWLKCFKNTIFEYLTKGCGQAAELLVDERHSIVGLQRVGRQRFHVEEGKTVPFIDRREQEPGTQSLFR